MWEFHRPLEEIKFLQASIGPSGLKMNLRWIISLSWRKRWTKSNLLSRTWRLTRCMTRFSGTLTSTKSLSNASLLMNTWRTQPQSMTSRKTKQETKTTSQILITLSIWASRRISTKTSEWVVLATHQTSTCRVSRMMVIQSACLTNQLQGRLISCMSMLMKTFKRTTPSHAQLNKVMYTFGCSANRPKFINLMRLIRLLNACWRLDTERRTIWTKLSLLSWEISPQPNSRLKFFRISTMAKTLKRLRDRSR